MSLCSEVIPTTMLRNTGRINEFIPPEPASCDYEAVADRRSDWRWKQARYYSERHARNITNFFTRKNDPLVVNTLCPFLEKYDKAAKDLEDMEELRKKQPALLWAVEKRQEENKSSLRWFVEAMICADMDVRDIAKELLLPPDYIWWYEKVFFDIRAIIDNVPRMVSEVFGHFKFKEDLIQDFFYKSVAWKHGLGTDALIKLASPVAGMSKETMGMLRDVIEKKMALDTVAALRSRSINSFNDNLVIDQFQRAIENRPEMGESQGTGAGLDAGLKQFLGHIATHVGVATYETEFNGIEGVVEVEPEGDLFNTRRKEAAEIEAEAADNKEI